MIRDKITLYRVNKAMKKGSYLTAGRLMGLTTEQILNMTTQQVTDSVLTRYMHLIRRAN